MAEQNKEQQSKVETVPKDLYIQLLNKVDNLETEVDTYRQKSPIVGVRWYGEGGFGIGLTHPINGVTRIALSGFNDAAVIDYSTWLRIKNTEQAKDGLLVRDDTVIEEHSIMGKVAQKDNTNPGPNSLTQKQAETLLKGSMAQFKKIVSKMDSHWGPTRLIKTANLLEIQDETKMAYLRERRDNLLSEFRWNLLHPHDLKLACERHGISGWQTMDKDRMVKELTAFEINMLKLADERDD